MSGYGLGWVVGAYGGQRLISHSGGTLGFSSLVTFLPEADLGMVMLTNGAVGVAGHVQLRRPVPAARAAVRPAGGVRCPARARSSPRPPRQRAELLAHLGQVDPAAVTPYLGRYANPDLGELTLALREGAAASSRPARTAPHCGRQLEDDGTVAGYVLVDPPLGGFPPELTLTFEQTPTEPRIVLTLLAPPGEADLVYPFAPVGAAATPAP